MTTKENRGGRRPGAGRPRLEESRAHLVLAVAPEVADMVRELRAGGVRVTALLEEFVRGAYNSKLIYGLPQTICTQATDKYLRIKK